MRWYTRILAPFGSAIRIGLDSGTKIVLLPHPTPKANSSNTQSLDVAISIDSDAATGNPLFEVCEERESECGNKFVEHDDTTSIPLVRSSQSCREQRIQDRAQRAR